MPIFRKCKDPALIALNEVGYNIVKLPRVDLLPTQLLYSKGKKLRRLGDLTSVFVPMPDGPALPPILNDQPGPNIAGKKSAALNVDIGLDILGGLISALGGSTLGISMAYAEARSIEFSFGSTRRTDTDLALVDQFLASASINPYARASREMLNNDAVYVVTSTLKSDNISVTAKTSDNQSLQIDLPVIQNAIGANLKVTANTETSTVVTYTGAVPLVIGFQAEHLIFEGDTMQTLESVGAGDVTAESVSDHGRLDPDIMLGADF